MEIFLIVLLCVVIICPFGLAWYFWSRLRRHRRFMETAQITHGEVIALSSVETNNGYMVAPIMQYTVNRKAYEAKPDLLLQPKKVAVGQTLQIRYDPNNPEKIAVMPNGRDTTAQVYRIYAICMLLGGIAVLLTQYYIFFVD
ncbi:DUF3592 domain-containing protein [Larkinella soli]|uniref:DUF3592 domain-containing protein n=1 Tax=Larkinella soli TaxID=1770527 RepID=UPI000FFB672F|nr:DUF3592 domain-containing protein [Larkinella soli]